MKIIVLVILSVFTFGLINVSTNAQTVPVEPIVDIVEDVVTIPDEVVLVPEVSEPIVTKVVEATLPDLNQVTPAIPPTFNRDLTNPVMFTGIRNISNDSPSMVSGSKVVMSSTPALASSRLFTQTLASASSPATLKVSTDIPSSVAIDATYPNQTAEVRNSYIPPNTLSIEDVIKPLIIIGFVMLILAAGYLVYKQSKISQKDNRFTTSHA